MPLGQTLNDILREYAMTQTKGPDWREKLAAEEFQKQQRQHAVEQMKQESELNPLKRRAAELDIAQGEQNLTVSRAHEAERQAHKAQVAAEIAKGNLSPLWEADPEAARFIESAPDRATARKHAQLVIDHLNRQIANEPTPEEATALRAAQRGEIAARTGYYNDRGGAASALAAARLAGNGPYTGAAVHDKVLAAARAEAMDRVKQKYREPGMLWGTNPRYSEGTPEYNRRVAEEQAAILQEQGYDPRAIAKSGLKVPAPEAQFVRTPNGDCYMQQGQAVAKVDCRAVEDQQPDQTEGTTPGEIAGASGPGLAEQGMQALLDAWHRIQKAAGNPRVK